MASCLILRTPWYLISFVQIKKTVAQRRRNYLVTHHIFGPPSARIQHSCLFPLQLWGLCSTVESSPSVCPHRPAGGGGGLGRACNALQKVNPKGCGRSPTEIPHGAQHLPNSCKGPVSISKDPQACLCLIEKGYRKTISSFLLAIQKAREKWSKATGQPFGKAFQHSLSISPFCKLWGSTETSPIKQGSFSEHFASLSYKGQET